MNKNNYIPRYEEAIKWTRPKAQKKVNLTIYDITDKDIQNANSSELKNYLEFFEKRLNSIQNKSNPNPNDEKFGGPASQWSFKNCNEIQICKR